MLYVQADMVAEARVDVVKDDGVVTITVIVSCAYELKALLLLKPYSPFFYCQTVLLCWIGVQCSRSELQAR